MARYIVIIIIIIIIIIDSIVCLPNSEVYIPGAKS